MIIDDIANHPYPALSLNNLHASWQPFGNRTDFEGKISLNIYIYYYVVIINQLQQTLYCEI